MSVKPPPDPREPHRSPPPRNPKKRPFPPLRSGRKEKTKPLEIPEPLTAVLSPTFQKGQDTGKISSDLPPQIAGPKRRKLQSRLAPAISKSVASLADQDQLWYPP